MLSISHLVFQASLPFKPKALRYSMAVRIQVRSGVSTRRLLEAYLKTRSVAVSRRLPVVCVGAPWVEW